MEDLLSTIAIALVHALPWTLILTVSSFAIGAVLAIPVCAIASAKNSVVKAVSHSIILVIRSVPPIVWLFIIFFGIGNGILPLSPVTSAIAGLGLITAVNLGEIYRGAMKAVSSGQFEAAKVLGLSGIRQYTDVLVPQIFRVALPSAATYAIGLLKDTAVASTIGVPEMAQAAYRVSQQTFKGLEVYVISGLLYFGISLVMAYISRNLDKRLRQRIAR
ncbi:amino acid ABC transporter permease [Burkholderia humptydooensis]|uniref:Amino acid ABC transporter permease n=1 Tax=Burkholderia humptydooensis TaxID=430531 RepID=A0A7U4SST3_9BURK|nr:MULTISPECIES: amino acid ABC transporter permease [Burkholderia]AJY43395.1 amino ABC transporter, permease, 3-TM region, His/Glu/Gln/Arg/opine family domain protein [Burkholderia sp. 2002721687]ALX43178.1 amino acid ABC transporter permease [Burkholderia humptydooensis]QPS44911.1 amino acid ABC transporter permease [Burkholderia humptydooensis]